MKKLIFTTLFFLLFAIVCNPQKSFAQLPPIEIEAKTFMLSNEAPGCLIDNLIANGYGDSCLYAVMQYLQPFSGGAISQGFMDSLASCPANSDVFTAKLNNFSDPSNNPVGIGEDGNLIVAPIYGRDHFGKEGYTTYNDTLVPVSLKLFTKTIGPDFYIDAGTSQTPGVTAHYQAFAIAWSMGSTFVLSNEGGLIDDLIRAGHVDKNLYQTLEVLKPNSGGVISDEFMATLTKCPAGSDIFTAALSDFGGLNNPVCVNSDGTMSIQAIFARDYFSKEGFTTISLNKNGYTPELFSYANSAENYINAGISGTSRGTAIYYKAFAIAWKASTTFVLTNEGGLIDQLIADGYGDGSLYEALLALEPASGGVISASFLNTLSDCSAASEIFTVKLSNFAGLNNPVGINSDGTVMICSIYAKDFYQKEGYATYPESQAGVGRELFTYATSPEYYINSGIEMIGIPLSNYKVFAIGWSAPAVGIRDAETSLKSPSVYPNPFGEGFYIHNLPEQTRIEIFDIRGKLIYHVELKDNSMIQPGFLHKGIYILKLKNN